MKMYNPLYRHKLERLRHWYVSSSTVLQWQRVTRDQAH